MREGTALLVLLAVLAGCGLNSPSVAPFTPEAPPSVEAELEQESSDIAAAFLDRMADPDVTYRVSGEVVIGEGDPPAARVTTLYDVAGDRYGGNVRVRGPALGESAGRGDWQTIALDGMTHIWDSSVLGWRSGGSSRRAHVPNPWMDLTPADLVFMGVTEDGHFEFDVAPWIGGDPVGEWVDVDALEAEGLVPITVESHRTRLTLDAGAIPHRVTSSFTFVAGPDAIAGRGSLVDQYSDMGLYVTLSAPELDIPLVTSHDLTVGVDDEHVAITEPFFEILPAEADAAQLNIEFEQPDQPILLGIEGAIGFIRSLAPDGTLQLDTIVSFEGDTVDVPIGEQTLVVYYRTCGGFCSHLDGPTDFCVVDAEIEEGGAYEMTVKVVNADRAVCELTPPG